MTITCSGCDQPLSHDAKFCARCGKAVDADAPKRRSVFRYVLWIAGGLFAVLFVLPLFLGALAWLGKQDDARPISQELPDPRYDAVPINPDNRAALVANMSRDRVLSYKWASREEVRLVFGTPYSTSLTGDQEYWYYSSISRDPVTGRRDRSVQFVIDVNKGRVVAINF